MKNSALVAHFSLFKVTLETTYIITQLVMASSTITIDCRLNSYYITKGLVCTRCVDSSHNHDVCNRYASKSHNRSPLAHTL